ncbi:MAG: hypothetical protein HOO06_13590 [Bdellovibrionaceae bacterium]|nr:hypothetical protein [Pseudobdellovibrionaceae bacterium]
MNLFKYLVIATTLLTSLAVSAQTSWDSDKEPEPQPQFSVRSNPVSPVVVGTDTILPTGETVHGPWFKTRFSLINDLDVSVFVSSLIVVIEYRNKDKAVVWRNDYFVELDVTDHLEIPAQSHIIIPVIHFENLMKTSNYIFDVEVKPVGYYGDSKRLEHTYRFKTQ